MSVLRARDIAAFDTKEVKKDYDFVAFISDTRIDQGLVNQLRNYNVKHLSYEPELFLNHDFKHFQDQGIQVLWLDLTQMKCLQWVQLNIATPSKYRLINVYTVKSEANQWVKQLGESVDNTLSLKSLLKIKCVNIVQYIESLVNFSKVSKPKKWYVRAAIWILKKVGIL
jgi:hypothetical protein